MHLRPICGVWLDGNYVMPQSDFLTESDMNKTRKEKLEIMFFNSTVSKRMYRDFLKKKRNIEKPVLVPYIAKLKTIIDAYTIMADNMIISVRKIDKEKGFDLTSLKAGETIYVVPKTYVLKETQEEKTAYYLCVSNYHNGAN